MRELPSPMLIQVTPPMIQLEVLLLRDKDLILREVLLPIHYQDQSVMMTMMVAFSEFFIFPINRLLTKPMLE
jgi:hypothetical protein